MSAQEAAEWGLINKVVGSGGVGDSNEMVAEAIRLAEMIANNSSDSVIVTREGVKMGWYGVSTEKVTRKLEQDWFPRMDQGQNMKEGLKAFVDKEKACVGDEQAIIQENAKCHTCDKIHVTTLVYFLGHSNPPKITFQYAAATLLSSVIVLRVNNV